VVLAAACLAASSAPAADSAAPWLRQKGTGFVDTRGRPVLLRGFDAFPSADSYQRAVALGANFVRLPLYWSRLEPGPPQGDVHVYDEQLLTRITETLGYLRDRGVHVLIDFHQYKWSSYFPSGVPSPGAGIPAWLYADGRYPPTRQGRPLAVAAFYTDPTALDLYSSFVRAMVERFRSFPNVVGYEILNEPQWGNLPPNHATTQLIIEWEAKVRRVISAADPARTVFFMLRGGGLLGLQQADLRPFGSRRNLAIDVHDYFVGTEAARLVAGGEDWFPSWFEATTGSEQAYSGTLQNQLALLALPVRRARLWGIPLLVGEWGIKRDDPGQLVYQRQMLTVFDRYGLSWARWGMSRTDVFAVLNPDGTPIPSAVQLTRGFAHLCFGAASPRVGAGCKKR
jgi:hypothetical protein